MAIVGAVSQIYIVNQEQRAQQADLKCFQFGQKESSSRPVHYKDRAESSIAEKDQRDKKKKAQEYPGKQQVSPFAAPKLQK